MIRNELKTAAGNLLSKYASGIMEQFPEMVSMMLERPFRASDTGVHPKLLADWNRSGLLLTEHQKNKRHDFTLTEAVWIKMIEKFRQYNFPIETIRAFRNELVSSPEVEFSTVMENPDLMKGVFAMFPEEHHAKLNSLLAQPDALQKLLSAFPINPKQVNQLDGIVLFALITKTPISFLLDHNGNGSIFSPILFEEAEVSQKEFHQIVAQSHVAISVTEAVADILGTAPIEKVSGSYGFLTDEEVKVIKELNTPNLVSATIKFDSTGDMDLIELTEDKAVDKRARLMELILMNGYQDITIKTQDGNIAVYRNTRKIKLK